MQYYKHHVFFCINQRTDGRACCQDHNALAMRDYMKMRIKQESLSGKGGVRVNQAGCLDRREHGPVMVIYPEGTWYTYMDEEDIDDVINQHIKGGQPVSRLLID